jgi:hypothetical protein
MSYGMGQPVMPMSSSLDWGLYNQRNTHGIIGTVRYNKIFGYTPYSGAYFMNTDTTTISGRRFLKPYDGFASTLRFAKVSGVIRYNTQVKCESDKYDPNDLGYLQAPNEVNYSGSISYNQFKPTRNFLNYNYTISFRQNYLFKPYRYSLTEVSARGFWLIQEFLGCKSSCFSAT